MFSISMATLIWKYSNLRSSPIWDWLCYHEANMLEAIVWQVYGKLLYEKRSLDWYSEVHGARDIVFTILTGVRVASTTLTMLGSPLTFIFYREVSSRPRNVVQFSVGLGAVQGMYNKQWRLAASWLWLCQTTVRQYDNQFEGSHLKMSWVDGWLLWQAWAFSLYE